jgi:hypothetical protein
MDVSQRVTDSVLYRVELVYSASGAGFLGAFSDDHNDCDATHVSYACVVCS